MLCATSHLERVPHRAVYGRRQHPHEHARPTTDGARRKTSTHRRKRETKDRKHHEARESDRSATASQGTRQAGGGRRKRKREGKSHRDRKHLHQAQRPSTPYARAKKQNNLENHTYMNTWSKARAHRPVDRLQHVLLDRNASTLVRKLHPAQHGRAESGRLQLQLWRRRVEGAGLRSTRCGRCLSAKPGTRMTRERNTHIDDNDESWQEQH